jgi:uncharacterized protein DUF6027
VTGGGDVTVVVVEPWRGPWPADDPDANFKADVALYANADPMETVRGLSAHMRIPEGAIVHYVLARYATGGTGGLLELGPSMVHRLWAPIGAAEEAGTDAARLAAYDQVRQMVAWLRQPLLDAGQP